MTVTTLRSAPASLWRFDDRDWLDAEPSPDEMRGAMTDYAVPSEAPPVVVSIVEDVMDRSHMIEFLDEGDRYTKDTGDDYVPLSAMAAMKYAIGNCHAASWAVAESTCIPEVQLLGVRYAKNEESRAPLSMNCHYALLVRDEDSDEDWVVDFTARQFDKSEPFPLALPLAAWKQKIDAHVARLFEQEPGIIVIEGQ